MAEGSDTAGRVFGIDLGTTYSAIAYIDETGRPTVCRNDNNAETMPSVVHFETADNVVVGQTAKDFAVIDPDNVVSLIKRKMGEEFPLTFHGLDQTPESISALILRRLAADAAQYTDGGPVERVVITVPAYFGARQKEATRQAGVIAGLDVVGILPEPVAAAVHYDAMSGSGEKTVLVYDLGGGTFDTTVITVGATDITVVCTDGATDLGGADWDHRLRDHILERFVAEASPSESAEDDNEFMQQLTSRAEEVKKQLSNRESRPVPLQFAGASARIEVSRTDFESMTSDLLDRTIDIVRRTLATLEEKQPGATIDEVLLVGGSTRMPMVADRLVKEFGWNPKLHDPDLAVAKGAAIFALSRLVWRMQQEAMENADTAEEGEREAAKVAKEVAQQYGLPESTVVELTKKRTQSVLPRAFGVLLHRDNNDAVGFIKHMAFANDTLPTGDRNLPAHTLRHDQTSVDIVVYEQAGPVLSEDVGANKPLTDADGTITGIPPQPPGQTADIDIVMSVNQDGLLQLYAKERSTGHDLTIQTSVGMTVTELDEAIDAASKITVSS
jgi:molecular chaperone DnaK